MNKTLLIILGALIILGGYFIIKKATPLDEAYIPVIVPADFSTTVDNPYFTLEPGTTFTYEADTDEGKARIVTTVTNEEKQVMGVDVVVVWDREFLNDELIEETRDWYAEDKEGNVWYFGEATAELEDGVVVTTEGSWEAGVDGAQPGIIMKGNPKIGDSYWQEFYAGEAEDRADVLSLSETVTVPYGTFTGCLKTFDYTPLNSNAKENKFYCPDVGNITLELDMEDGERAELVSVEHAAAGTVVVPPMPPAQTPPASQTLPPTQITAITEAEAKAIALAQVSGTVTGIEMETKFGKKVYVVEVDPTYGAETDVIIDIATGEVLAVEN